MALPVIMTSSGAVPTDVTTIRDTLDASITLASPGYTSRLPGTLVEDLLSTDTASVAACDQARVDAINSIPATTVNEYLLTQLGACKGILQNESLNTRAYVQFTGPPGVLIPKGFQVSDGVHIYSVATTTVISSTGSATSLSMVVAQDSGVWDIAIGSINQVINQPTQGTITVSNPVIGLPYSQESMDEYRSRVLTADSMGVQGSPAYIKSQLASVSGVILRSLSVKAYGTGYLVCAAGGDIMDIASALYQSIGDITLLRGSSITITGATQASPCTITTAINHNLVSGMSVTISGALGMTELNGSHVVTVLSPTTFTIPVDTTASPTYQGSGFLVNNSALQTVTIYEGSDAYDIVFLLAQPQVLSLVITWSGLPNLLVTNQEVAANFAPAALDYINSLTTGSSINLQVLKNSLTNSLEAGSIAGFTELNVEVLIDGQAVSPTEGSLIIDLDEFCYPMLSLENIQVTQV